MLARLELGWQLLPQIRGGLVEIRTPIDPGRCHYVDIEQ